ncbi:MAG: hypothetical protein ACREQW_10600 [Candidatus Binatia bacterium]
MNRDEAQSLLRVRVAELKAKSYPELKALLNNPECFEAKAGSGQIYQIEWEAFWESAREGNLKIIASIDDGKLSSSIVPITLAFVVTPGGKILD